MFSRGEVIGNGEIGQFRAGEDPFVGIDSTLGKVMLDAGAPPSTKVRAAGSILNHTIKAIEVENIEARVAALEAAAPRGQQRR